MNEIAPLVCPPPGPDRKRRISRAVDAWSSSSAIRDLVRLFGGTWNEEWSASERLDFLAKFSDCWDFRRGAERLDAVAASLDEDGERTVQRAAASLGMTIASPPRLRSYDYVLVLGGIALSCKLRTDHAAQIIRDGVTTPLIALLGALREISNKERASADAFAPGSRTEFDVLNAAAERAFEHMEEHVDSVTQSDNPNLTAVVRRYQRPALPDVISLSAPSSDPNRRANTEDAYAFFADVVDLRHGQTVLICSSQIYYPFHLMNAMRMLALPYDVSVEVVGFPLDWASGESALRGTHNLLQEVRSGILAAVSLMQYLS